MSDIFYVLAVIVLYFMALVYISACASLRKEKEKK